MSIKHICTRYIIWCAQGSNKYNFILILIEDGVMLPIDAELRVPSKQNVLKANIALQISLAIILVILPLQSLRLLPVHHINSVEHLSVMPKEIAGNHVQEEIQIVAMGWAVLIHPLMHNREEPVPILIIQDPITSSVEDLGVMVSFVYVYVMVKYACIILCVLILYHSCCCTL